METAIEPRVRTIERPLDWSLIEAAGENVLERFRQDLRDIGLDIELFETRMGNMLRTPVPRVPLLARKEEFVPALDIEDTGTNYLVRMNLPGVPKDLVAVKFLDQNLEVEAETKAVKETEKKNYVLKERTEAGYHRRISFPTPIAPEKAEAKLDHGVLAVTIPKLKPAKELKVPLV
jgi:HSP20 family protein